jgi:hypothetical protein
MPKDLEPFIQLLQSKNFKAEYPTYNGMIDLSETAFFDAEHFTPEAIELLKEKKEFNKERKLELKQFYQHALNVVD